MFFAGVFIHGGARVLNRGVQVKEYIVGFMTLILFGIIMHLMLLTPNLL